MDFLIGLWTRLQFKDMADIFLVTFLIYQGLLIIKGTRAVQMLTGIGVLIALFWLGQAYNLYSLNWILNHFFDSFFIIVIILFQDQFRNALANFGRSRGILFHKENGKSGMDFEEVIEACQSMSREKIGALMVFERDEGLLNYIETGTSLESHPHSDLIYAIFQSKSPLHDGAIIFSHGKIMAAGCFLPLSKNIEIDRHMGTRHRAALGITEQSDAIAVIVSEETGTISVCFQGAFYPCENLRELRQYLKQFWAKQVNDFNIGKAEKAN